MINDYRFDSGQFSVNLFVFKLTGEDVESFLQTQSTFDVKKIEKLTFHLASFLDPQGRLETYGWLVRTESEFLYLAPNLLKEKTLLRLNKFLVSEDVTIEERGLEDWWFVLGPKVSHLEMTGKIFGEIASLQPNRSEKYPIISSSDVELWRGLNGWPGFFESHEVGELINNTRLFDLSVNLNKGCYPGQETVSKIATRRGAAYSPVLLETESEISLGDLYSFDKKIGTAWASYTWNGKRYYSVSLLRDFRVEGLKLKLSLNGNEIPTIVRYFPLLATTPREKGEELFYEATDHFKHDEMDKAEAKLRQSIEVDNTFADAYESLGVLLGRLERFQEAIDVMKKLSEVDPSSVLAHTNMSLFLMRQGKIPEAEEQKSLATIKSFQKFGQEAKEKELKEAEQNRQKDEWIKRESMFHQVLEIDSEDTLANYGLGSIAVEKGDWSKASAYLEKVLQADPQYSVAYLALGRAYKALGKSEDAKRIWSEGIKVAAKKGDLMPANQMQSELERF